jgi:uncharacterized protein YggE
MKSVAIVLVAAAAVIAAGCGGNGDSNEGTSTTAVERAQLAAYGDQPAPAGAAVSAAGITVVGTGSASAVPDEAEWSFGVRAEADTASGAMNQAATVSKQVISALKDAGIKGEDLRTESVSLYPQQDEMGQNIIGYSASSTVHATMQISKAGQIIDRVVAVGANEIYGPNLRVSNSDEQYAQAVDEAFDDARARAEAVARKAGVALGAPVAIVEGGGGGMPIPYYGRTTLAEGAFDMAIEPGQQDIQAVLTVTFAIS